MGPRDRNSLISIWKIKRCSKVIMQGHTLRYFQLFFVGFFTTAQHILVDAWAKLKGNSPTLKYCSIAYKLKKRIYMYKCINVILCFAYFFQNGWWFRHTCMMTMSLHTKIANNCSHYYHVIDISVKRWVYCFIYWSVEIYKIVN